MWPLASWSYRPGLLSKPSITSSGGLFRTSKIAGMSGGSPSKVLSGRYSFMLMGVVPVTVPPCPGTCPSSSIAYQLLLAGTLGYAKYSLSDARLETEFLKQYQKIHIDKNPKVIDTDKNPKVIDTPTFPKFELMKTCYSNKTGNQWRLKHTALRHLETKPNHEEANELLGIGAQCLKDKHTEESIYASLKWYSNQDTKLKVEYGIELSVIYNAGMKILRRRPCKALIMGYKEDSSMLGYEEEN
nr:hypothetical protein Iba_chr07bCG9750 [Ipomoea batatas]